MSADDMVVDAPITLKGARPGHPWVPKNYDGKYYGTVTLKTALAKSLNAATVRLAEKTGVGNIIETAQRLGIKSNLQPYLPLALGASDVVLMDMISAYGTFATGQYVKPLLYDRIINKDGLVLDEPASETTDLVSPEDVEQMRKLLHAVVEEGTAQKAKELKRTLYGKTGTTNDYTDAWFMGFDDRLVVGVWVGRDDHTPIGTKETGARAALPIWMEFMKKAPLQTPLNQNP
jgi:penicillin-binding protein 1A